MDLRRKDWNKPSLKEQRRISLQNKLGRRKIMGSETLSPEQKFLRVIFKIYEI